MNKALWSLFITASFITISSYGSFIANKFKSMSAPKKILAGAATFMVYHEYAWRKAAINFARCHNEFAESSLPKEYEESKRKYEKASNKAQHHFVYTFSDLQRFLKSPLTSPMRWDVAARQFPEVQKMKYVRAYRKEGTENEVCTYVYVERGNKDIGAARFNESTLSGDNSRCQFFGLSLKDEKEKNEFFHTLLNCTKRCKQLSPGNNLNKKQMILYQDFKAWAEANPNPRVK